MPWPYPSQTWLSMDAPGCELRPGASTNGGICRQGTSTSPLPCSIQIGARSFASAADRGEPPPHPLRHLLLVHSSAPPRVVVVVHRGVALLHGPVDDVRRGSRVFTVSDSRYSAHATQSDGSATPHPPARTRSMKARRWPVDPSQFGALTREPHLATKLRSGLQSSA